MYGSFENMMWPAMSKVKPLSSTDRHHPPTRSACSTRRALLPRWYAALKPVGPAPTTTTGVTSDDGSVCLGGMLNLISFHSRELSGSDCLRGPATVPIERTQAETWTATFLFIA